MGILYDKTLENSGTIDWHWGTNAVTSGCLLFVTKIQHVLEVYNLQNNKK